MQWLAVGSLFVEIDTVDINRRYYIECDDMLLDVAVSNAV